MSNVMQYDLRLFGPYAGQDININGHAFRKGELTFIQKPEAVGFALRVLSYYGAYAKGTPEYDEALAKEELNNGISVEVDKSAGSGASEQVSSDRESSRGEITKETVDVGDGYGEFEKRDTGVFTDRDGCKDTRIPEFEKEKDRVEPEEPQIDSDPLIAKAVMKLDPNHDGFWTQMGLPKLSAVEELYGKAGVTRAKVEAAAPGYTRETALENVDF
jgi:hypothetical protein